MKNLIPQPKTSSAIAASILTTCTLAAHTFLPLNPIQGVPSASAAPIATSISPMRFNPPPPPPDFGAPGRRGGGAGRNCGMRGQALTALAPEYKQALGKGEIIKVWGTTTETHPTIWFDVPYPASSIKSMEFILKDDVRPANEIYRTALTPPASPGIIGVALPTSVPSLKVGTAYEWFLKVNFQCDSVASTSEQIHGWIQRVTPNAALLGQLKQLPPQQQPALLAENGLWYDTVTTLAQLRRADPQSTGLNNDWKLLLQSVGLQTLSTKPLVDCCTPSKSPALSPASVKPRQ